MFEAQKGPDGQTYMIALRPRGADLRAFHPTELLETPMVGLDRPNLSRPCLLLGVAHLHMIGRPVLRVTVWGDDPKHLDQPIAFQMDNAAIRANGHLGYWAIPRAIRINKPIGLELRQPMPAIAANELEVRQATVATVERDHAWRESTLLCRGEHRSKMVVFRGAIRRFIVEAVVAGDASIAITPQQRYEIDAADHAVMLARPVPPDKFDGTCVGLVQRRIINDEHPCVQGNLLLGLGPEPCWVWLQPMQQAGDRIMRWCVSALCLHPACFQTTVRGRRGDQEVDIVEFVGFRRVHTGSVAHNVLTA